MKKFTAWVIFILPLVMLLSCLKDSYKRTYTYTYYQPVYKTAAEVRANIKSNGPQPVKAPGKIYIKGNYIFLNEIDKGIHIIDNTNPSAPKNVAFIDIPGNLDIAVKGNTLYADLYTDLVAIDISTPQSVQVKKIIDGVFPYRYYANNFTTDRSRIIVDWMKKDTTVTENINLGGWLKSSPGIFFASTDALSNVSASPVGVGGSMARFTIVNDRLYTVGLSDLQVFNIYNTNDPVPGSKKSLGSNIETIYPFKNKLFIGSQTGMFIYNISNPDNPTLSGQFSHVQSCDPVVADDNYAYVTLRTGNRCRGINNELDVLKLNDVVNPTLLKQYPMTNPFGLSKDGNYLLICDGKDGLKIYNATDPLNISLLKTISGIETYDVIANGGWALVVAKDGLYQYDYSNINNISLISKINVGN